MNSLFGGLGQRIAAYFAAGLIIYYAGTTPNSTLLGLLIVVIIAVLEFLAYSRGVEDGITMYRSLTASQKREIDKLLDDEDIKE